MSPAEGSRRITSKLHVPTWQESEVRRALEAATSAGVVIVTPDGQKVYVNEKFCDLVGYSAGELLRERPPFAYWPPEERDSIHSAFLEALEGDAPPEGLEVRFQKRGGERFDACLTFAPIRGESGNPGAWLIAVSDITSRKRSERRRAAEDAIVRILAAAPSLDEALPRILAAFCEHLNWDAGAWWRVDHSAALVPVIEQWVTPRLGADSLTDGFAIPPGTGLPGRVWASGEPMWVADLGSFEGFLRGTVARSEGLRSAFAFPIKTRSGVSGIAEFFSRQPQPRDEEVLGTAAALGLHVWQFIEREQARLAIQQSEARHRAILETANEGVWLIDRDARTVYANKRLADMLGLDLPELIERNVAELCFPEDVDTVRERIAANLEGRLEQFDFRFRRKDGSELLTLACTSPMRDGQGRIVGALGMLSDVTERKKNEQAVYRLAAIVESSEDAIIGKTLDGIIQSWNSAAERLYGYSAEEAIGRSMTILLPPDRPDEEASILERLHRGERVEHFETVRKRKDGQLIDVSTSISPIRDKHGHISGASSVTRDITERRRFEEQIRETQKLESLGVLAGGVAHDFNNLLVGIMGNASLAVDTIADDNPARAMIDGVLQASERAANLTRQLLAYSGKGRFVVQSIDLSLLIREIVALIQTSISKSVLVRFELDAELPPIEADVAQIQQLVMNLVINAAEAIGAAPGTVTIRTRVVESPSEETGSGPFVLLEVEDNGCGMDQTTRERIFEPFFTTKFTGRGLGLAAVQGIVRGHRGRVEVDTTPGLGTRFRVQFPAAAGTLTQVRHLAARELQGHGTVLVVDDEEIVRNTARATLERFGYQVLVASDGQEALECLRGAPQIGMVLLDLTMPVMSGEDALHEMRRIRPELRVVLSSGFNEVEAIRRFQGQGLSGFLQKPYTAEMLAEKVKTVWAAA